MVISSTRRPPAAKARASGTACSRSLMVSTGITGARSTISRISTRSSHQRQCAGLGIARGAAQARKQLASAALLVARMIDLRQLPPAPDMLGDLRLEDAGVTIQTDHIAVAHPAQGTAVQTFGSDVNRGG